MDSPGGANEGQGMDRFPREMRIGLVLWLVFCCVLVPVWGVHWDEAVEHGQVITRQIPYPEGHPLFRYARNVYSLQFYSAAAVLLLFPDPVVACALRNLLFMMATVLPIYLLAAHLTRKALWGHVAVLVVLLGIHRPFASYYPFFIWPGQFSNGQIGSGLVLLILYLLLAGRWRTGYFLLGLMPCIHIGQMPVLAAVAGLFTLWQWRRRETQRLASALKWAMAGLVLCVVFWGIKQPFYVPPPTDGPYVSTADARAIWRNYVTHYDVHRGFPRYNPFGHTNIAMAAMLLLGAAMARREWLQDRGPGPRSWVFLFALLTATTVWGVMALRTVMGDATPYLLLGWIPYRLANHVILILVPTLFGALCRDPRRISGMLVAAGAMLYGVLGPLLGPLLGPEIYSRYLESGEGLMFILCGAAFGAVLLDSLEDRRFAVPWLGTVAVALTALAVYHQFGAFCAACGFAALLSIEFVGRRIGKWDSDNVRRALGAATGVLCAVLVLVLLHDRWQNRSHLFRTAFDVEVAEYLEKQGEPDALIVSPPWAHDLLSRIGSPTMTDYCIPQIIAYVPPLAPSIKKLYSDIYCVYFEHPDRKDEDDRWTQHTRAQWQTLAAQYAFRYVLAPNGATVDLPRVLEGELSSLYRVP